LRWNYVTALRFPDCQNGLPYHHTNKVKHYTEKQENQEISRGYPKGKSKIKEIGK
jgi:hypothetical protein